jgi:hypothetical protein
MAWLGFVLKSSTPWPGGRRLNPYANPFTSSHRPRDGIGTRIRAIPQDVGDKMWATLGLQHQIRWY